MKVLTPYLPLLVEWLGVIAVTMLLSVSPALKNRPRLGFKYPRREGGVSLALFTFLLLLAMQFYRSNWGGILPAQADARLDALAARALLGLGAAGVIGLALLLRGQPLRSAGWGKAAQSAGLQVGLGLAVIAIFLNNKLTALMDGLSAADAYLLLGWMVLALAEETVFRGYIHPRLSAWLGPRWGWLAGAVLWTLWLLPGRLGVTPLEQLWLPLGFAFAQGLLLGWIYNKSGSVLATGLYRAVSGWIALL
jgi:membrane protease YdiL (CAAX protease family)